MTKYQLKFPINHVLGKVKLEPMTFDMCKKWLANSADWNQKTKDEILSSDFKTFQKNLKENGISIKELKETT